MTTTLYQQCRFHDGAGDLTPKHDRKVCCEESGERPVAFDEDAVTIGQQDQRYPEQREVVRPR